MRKNRYQYLCDVADYMNEEFKYEGSKNKAIVIRDEDSKFKYKIVILNGGKIR